ncbi:hypothetical protein ACFL0X_01660 [Nanoarchaeota archaeon]
MIDLEIPTYNTIVPNCTFGRPTDKIKHPINGNYYSATQIMCVERTSIPTKEDVIELIKYKAKYIGQLLEFIGCPQEGEDLTPGLIRKLLEEEREGIVNCREGTISHLKSHCSLGDYQTGQTYLRITNGVLPDELLLPSFLLDEKSATDYTDLIVKAGKDGWHLGIRLEDEYILPDKLEMDYLLDRKVRDCDVFNVCGEYRDYRNVVNQVGLLYNALNSPQIVGQIRDSSQQFLKSTAIDTIRTFALCGIRRKIEKSGGLDRIRVRDGNNEGIIELLKSMFNQIENNDDTGGDEQKQKPHKFDIC